MRDILDNVPYFGQFKPEACAAACLKMALGAISGADTSASETTLYNQTKDDEWADGSSPEKLARVYKTRGRSNAETVVVAKTLGADAETALIRRMAWSIKDARVPPIALVAWDANSDTGDGHWVLVAGYHANREPTGPDDEGCDVSGIEFSNPATAAEDQTYPNHVSIAWWRSRYMKPVGADIEGYAGSRVAVTGGRLESA